MIEKHLGAIDKLRTNRERSALVALHSSNRLRDKAAAEAARAVDFLRLEMAAQLASERLLYGQTLAQPLAPQELERVQSKIQRESAKVSALAGQCVKLSDLAKEAAATAEADRLRHAGLLRAKTKWEKIREYYAEKAQIEEVRRDDIAFDDLSRPNTGR
jgi:hypothetical protein